MAPATKGRRAGATTECRGLAGPVQVPVEERPEDQGIVLWPLRVEVVGDLVHHMDLAVLNDSRQRDGVLGGEEGVLRGPMEEAGRRNQVQPVGEVFALTARTGSGIELQLLQGAFIADLDA